MWRSYFSLSKLFNIKKQCFFTKNIHGGEKVECVLGRTLYLKNKIELPIHETVFGG